MSEYEGKYDRRLLARLREVERERDEARKEREQLHAKVTWALRSTSGKRLREVERELDEAREEVSSAYLEGFGDAQGGHYANMIEGWEDSCAKIYIDTALSTTREPDALASKEGEGDE